MSKRAHRKIRHRENSPTILTFKQRVHMGAVKGKLLRKEMTYDDVPQWMQDLANQAIPTMEETHEHIHNENCTHE